MYRTRVDTAIVDMDDDVKETIIKQIPAKRIGRVEEVAALVEFLLSDDAAYITKQVIGINGGLC